MQNLEHAGHLIALEAQRQIEAKAFDPITRELRNLVTEITSSNSPRGRRDITALKQTLNGAIGVTLQITHPSIQTLIGVLVSASNGQIKTTYTVDDIPEAINIPARGVESSNLQYAIQTALESFERPATPQAAPSQNTERPSGNVNTQRPPTRTPEEESEAKRKATTEMVNEIGNKLRALSANVNDQQAQKEVIVALAALRTSGAPEWGRVQEQLRHAFGIVLRGNTMNGEQLAKALEDPAMIRTLGTGIRLSVLANQIDGRNPEGNVYADQTVMKANLELQKMLGNMQNRNMAAWLFDWIRDQVSDYIAFTPASDKALNKMLSGMEDYAQSMHFQRALEQYAKTQSSLVATPAAPRDPANPLLTDVSNLNIPDFATVKENWTKCYRAYREARRKNINDLERYPSIQELIGPAGEKNAAAYTKTAQERIKSQTEQVTKNSDALNKQNTETINTFFGSTNRVKEIGPTDPDAATPLRVGDKTLKFYKTSGANPDYKMRIVGAKDWKIAIPTTNPVTPLTKMTLVNPADNTTNNPENVLVKLNTSDIGMPLREILAKCAGAAENHTKVTIPLNSADSTRIATSSTAPADLP